MNNPQQKLTRAALLLALLLLLQSLRLLIPLPPLASTFLIGSLVNACLVVALEMTGRGPAVLIGFMAPLAAYFQQMLPLPIFILPVAIGNLLYLALLDAARQLPSGLRIVAAAAAKTGFLYGAFYWLLLQLQLPAPLASALLLAMSWPQLATAIIGAMLGLYLSRRLRAV